MSLLSVRPNLASYQADVEKDRLGVNKLHRLVNYLKRDQLSPEERSTIRGMILVPNWNHSNYKMAKLAQQGVKIIDGIEKQKTVRVVDRFTLDIPIDEFRLEIPEEKEVPPPAPLIEEPDLDPPVPEIKQDPPPASPRYSDPGFEFDPQARIIRNGIEIIGLKPIEPTGQKGMRPQINIWQSIDEGPQISIVEADSDHTGRK